MATKRRKRSIVLPDCGMFVGSCVYLDTQDYLFQSSGWFSKWVPEDHSPSWYLQKIVDDNQGNLAALFDGGSSDRALKSMAHWMDLEGIGLTPPEPDWKNKKHLVPDDWDEIRKNSKRYGAGLFRFAKEAKEKGIYSFIIYGRSKPEWLKKAHQLGKWFLGTNIGESFTIDLDIDKGHGRNDTLRKEYGKITARFTLEDIKQSFERSVKTYIDELRKEGWPIIFPTSASFLLDYEIGAGLEIPMLEDFAYTHLNVASAFSRGLARQLDKEIWGAHLAHEHFSFLPYKSKYKFLLLKAAMYLKYLSGTKMVMLESGNWWQQAIHVDDTIMHDVPKPWLGGIDNTDPYRSAKYVDEARKYHKLINYNSSVCKRYRKVMSDFYDFVKKNGTPPGQPETTIAVAKGYLDGAGQEFNPNNAVWGAWQLAATDPMWYEAAPERGWDIMKDVFFPRKNTLGEFKNQWFSGTPYGMVDIVSLNCSITADFLLKNYKALIFLGWNTATNAQYRLLRQFVRGGGKLFISIPHLSRNKTRDFRNYSVNELIKKGDFRDLCGVRIKDRGIPYYWAMILNDKNPLALPKNKLYGVYWTHLGDIEINKDVNVIAVDNYTYTPILMRQQCAKGEVYFLNSWEYPGALLADTGPSAKTDSKGLVGEVLRTLGRECRGKVYITDDGSETGPECEYVAFSYFPSNKETYLLNIDADRSHSVFVHQAGKRKRRIQLKPFEFRVL